MVRKRSRRCSTDIESDSDGAYTTEAVEIKPQATKKYSLRERKRRPIIKVNFDSEPSDSDDDTPERPQSEDDEDFQIEPIIQEQEIPEETADVKTPPTKDESVDFEKLPANEPIDFEDIIRADIVVVNKTKIEESPSVRPQKRRGRKPKNYSDSNSSESNYQSSTDDKSETLLQEATEDCLRDTSKGTVPEYEINGASKASDEPNTSKDTTEPETNTINGTDTSKASILEMPVIRLNSKIETSSKIDMLVTQNYILQNEADLDDDDGIDDTFDFDDDVIVIEPKHEIIVLDD